MPCEFKSRSGDYPTKKARTASPFLFSCYIICRSDTKPNRGESPPKSRRLTSGIFAGIIKIQAHLWLSA